MNERIRQLAEQCTLFHTDYDFEHGFSAVEYFDKEKFAQLIVRECIQVCNSRVGNSDYNTGRMHCASDLKEHFGVEE